VGKKIGPELDGIGQRGLDRLIEDILDPSRTVDPAFLATVIRLKSGAIVTGLLLREEGNLQIYADDLGQEVRVPISDIAERWKSQLSPMPGDFADQIKPEDFNHLVAFLLTK
jgi:putative heme-binding domain-containing protein